MGPAKFDLIFMTAQSINNGENVQRSPARKTQRVGATREIQARNL
jgi:hypothetical protein